MLLAEMSESASIWLAVIGVAGSIATLAAGAFAAWMSFRVAQLNTAVKANESRIEKQEIVTDGLTTKLVAAVGAQKLAEGGMAERARADERDVVKTAVPGAMSSQFPSRS